MKAHVGLPVDHGGERQCRIDQAKDHARELLRTGRDRQQHPTLGMAAHGRQIGRVVAAPQGNAMIEGVDQVAHVPFEQTEVVDHLSAIQRMCLEQ